MMLSSTSGVTGVVVVVETEVILTAMGVVVVVLVVIRTARGEKGPGLR